MADDIDYGRASYKGIDFEILPVTNTIGQRKVVNLYPFSDFHYNERLGKKPERWSVRGLFTGPDARDKLQVAKRVWNTEGAGIFFEPMENRRHSVELNEDVVFSYDNTKINHITFTLELIEAANDPYPKRAADLFSRVNDIIDDFISTTSDYYTSAMSTVSAFIDITTGFEAATEFVFDTARQTVTGAGFPDLISVIDGAGPDLDAAQTVETVISLFETADDISAATAFYEQSTEVRVAGNTTEAAQGNLYALVAMAYYFQIIADEGVTFTELRDFRERAAALKAVVPDIPVSDAIDALLCELGRGVDYIECKQLPGIHHALDASYRLYGDISRAQEIMGYSGGVSGAALSTLLYR